MAKTYRPYVPEQDLLLPPSLRVLEERLRDRGTDSDEAIDRRLALADRELEAILDRWIPVRKIAIDVD